jgi:hypothetical protein
MKLRVLRISKESMAFSKPSANSADDTKALEEHMLSKWCENRSHKPLGVSFLETPHGERVV